MNLQKNVYDEEETFTVFITFLLTFLPIFLTKNKHRLRVKNMRSISSIKYLVLYVTH